MVRFLSRITLILALLSGAILLPASAPVAPGQTAPSLQDLLGTWQLEISYSSNDLSTGDKFKEKVASLFQLTSPGDNVVRLLDTVSQDEIFGRYVNGFLLIGRSSTPPTDGGPVPDASFSFVIQVSGSAPRLKGKGVGVEFEIDGEYASSAKLKMAKVSVE